MICLSCRHSALTRLSILSSRKPSHSLLRTVATVPSTPNAAPATPPQSTASGLSSSTSSQPFSDPFFPTSNAQHAEKPATPKSKKPSSSVPAGTPFNALKYTKTGPEIVAKEDSEYPSWLWTLLDERPKSTAEPTAAGAANIPGLVSEEKLSTMAAKTRAKIERKQARLLAGLEKPVPVHEQSRDLTKEGDGAKESLEKRLEIRGSMRGARRRGIREDNFLRAM